MSHLMFGVYIPIQDEALDAQRDIQLHCCGVTKASGAANASPWASGWRLAGKDVNAIRFFWAPHLGPTAFGTAVEEPKAMFVLAPLLFSF